MKRKILFIIGSLESGGVSKSIINLLMVMDYKKYDVSLLICNPVGIYFELLPSEVRIITNKKIQFLVNGIHGTISLLQKGYFFSAIGNTFRMFISFFNKGYAGWILSKLMPTIEEKFDTIVDYNGQHQLYYMIDKLKAKKKITFFHSDYSQWPYYYLIDKRYFVNIDKIYTISDTCVQVLKRYFPNQSGKINLMENIISPQLIQNMALMPIKIEKKEKYLFLTIGHICEGKGTGLAIQAASILKKGNIDFIWYFIGNISDTKYYENLLIEYDVTDKIKFIGLKLNPYPYLYKADIYIHPSQFEGKSIALDEAKILCKPIIVTNFSTVTDQFTNRVNASISDMNPEALANAIEELTSDSNLKKNYIENLKKHMIDNTTEINKLYSVFDK